jgi:hypothetical protein
MPDNGTTCSTRHEGALGWDLRFTALFHADYSPLAHSFPVTRIFLPCSFPLKTGEMEGNIHLRGNELSAIFWIPSLIPSRNT